MTIFQLIVACLPLSLIHNYYQRRTVLPGGGSKVWGMASAKCKKVQPNTILQPEMGMNPSSSNLSFYIV